LFTFECAVVCSSNLSVGVISVFWSGQLYQIIASSLVLCLFLVQHTLAH